MSVKDLVLAAGYSPMQLWKNIPCELMVALPSLSFPLKMKFWKLKRWDLVKNVSKLFGLPFGKAKLVPAKILLY